MSLPRYTKNLFISNEKNIMRTINTYIDYTDVGGIFLNYNKEIAKFQIHLEINKKKNIPDNCVHVYNRVQAKSNKTSIEKITEVLDGANLKLLYKKDFLNKLAELINSYKLKDENEFFILDKDKAEKLIYDILDKKSMMIAKRVYSNIFNRLTIKASINSLLSLKNKINCDIGFYKEDTIKELEELVSLLKNRVIDGIIDSNNIETSHKYKEIVRSIENYHNINYKSDISCLLNLNDLIYEKTLNEEYDSVTLKEIEIKQNLSIEIKEEIKSIFSDYTNVSNYLKENIKKFTHNSLTRMFNAFNTNIEHARKFNGIKRSRLLKTVKSDFGSTYEYLLNNSDSKNNLKKISKLVVLYQRKDILSEYGEKQIYYNQTTIERLIDEGYITNLETKVLNNLDLDGNSINEITKHWINNISMISDEEQHFYAMAQEEAINEEQYQEYLEDENIINSNIISIDTEQSLYKQFNQLISKETKNQSIEEYLKLLTQDKTSFSNDEYKKYLNQINSVIEVNSIF